MPDRPDKYQVKINWGWTGQYGPSFQEAYTTIIFDRANLKKTVKEFIVRMTRRYSFDCNRLTHPLRPYLGTIEVIPIYEKEYISPSDLGLDEFLKNEVKWTQQLIEDGRLFINNNYNTELAPANLEEEQSNA